MATRVDLPHDLVKEALELKQASLRRAQNNSTNPRLLEIFRQDLATYTKAIDTLAEVK